MKKSELRSLKAKKAWVQDLIKVFTQYNSDPQCELDYDSPEELLVATILSAQCTDKRVNIVTKKLFKDCKIPEELATWSLEKIEAYIFSTGFYKNKAKSLKFMSQDLVDHHKSKVPQKLAELIQLRGVGRKTANVVLGECFNAPEGVVVDTHVGRLAKRLGLTASENPVKIEQDLMKVIPKEYWVRFAHWLILHGRGPCKSRKTHCEKCYLSDVCPSSKLNF